MTFKCPSSTGYLAGSGFFRENSLITVPTLMETRFLSANRPVQMIQIRIIILNLKEQIPGYVFLLPMYFR